MKKITLSLFLICSLAFGIKAQNNWKRINNNSIIASVVSDQYTWALLPGTLAQISNSNNKIKSWDFNYINGTYFTMQAYGEGLVIVLDDEILHFENGIWTSLYKNSGVMLFSISCINKTTGLIAILDDMKDRIFLVKNKSIKVINFSGVYELGRLISIRNDNSILFNDLKQASDQIIEIDSNGIAKSILDNSKLNTNLAFIESIECNQNKLFFYSTNNGLNIVNFTAAEPTVQNISSVAYLRSKGYSSFNFDKTNSIKIFTESNSSRMICYTMSLNGIIIDSIKAPTGYSFSFRYAGVTENNKLIFKYIRDRLYIIDAFDWTNLYKYKHDYDGDMIEFSDLNTFITSERLFEYNNDIVKNIELDSLLKINIRLKVVKKINYKSYLIGDENGKLELYIKNENRIMVARIPISSSIEIKDLIVDAQEQVYLLTPNNILIYKIDKTWDTIDCNVSYNISSLNSFCIDKSGTIWIATNKGIASIINNEIALEDKLNIRFNTINIIYNQTKDYLIFNLINTVEERLYIHNLTSNQSQSFKTINYINKMIVNNKAELFTLRRNYGLTKFDLNIMKWDTSFNNNIIGTPFENKIYDFSLDDENRIYLFKGGISNYYYIYIYNEDGFLSAIKNLDNKVKINLNLFPIPFSDIINIDTKEILNSYSILNNEGKELQSGLITNNKIDTHRLPTGSYFIMFYGARGTISKKIIKN
jgi:Secretion system C-terminal sorting domain